MNDVIQNVNVSDIFTKIENIEISNSLIESIGKNGILEPLLLRPSGDRYEVVLGNKRFTAAKQLGLTTVPALIKDIDDNLYKEYNPNYSQEKTNPQVEIKKEKKKKNEEITKIKNNDIENEKTKNSKVKKNIYKLSEYNSKKNKDIVNLKELNEKKEERDEFNMNNNQVNINSLENNEVKEQKIVSPTFGGRFFPSLEDEPTNINIAKENNLIDLTNLNTQSNETHNNDLNSNLINPIPDPMENVLNMNMNQPASSNMNTSNVNQNIVPSMDVSRAEPVVAQPTVEPVMMATPNIPQVETVVEQPSTPIVESVAAQPTVEPVMMATPNIPQVETVVEQTGTPIVEFVAAQPTVEPVMMATPNIPQVETVVEQPSTPIVEPVVAQPTVEPAPIAATEMSQIEQNQEIEMPEISQSTNNAEIVNNERANKDINPAINTIIGLATNLSEFGYDINIYEENLENSINLTIEINK